KCFFTFGDLLLSTFFLSCFRWHRLSSVNYIKPNDGDVNGCVILRLDPWQDRMLLFKTEESAMASSYDDIITAALALPPGSRAMLADMLLESLDSPDQKRLDELWVEEAERRAKEVDEGIVETIDLDNFLRSLRSRKK